MDTDTATFLADSNVGPKLSRFAVHDVIRRFFLPGR